METTRKSQITVLALLITVAMAASAQPATDKRSGSAEQIAVPAPALRGNSLGDTTEQPAIVYLPADYAEQSSKRYPVLYVLHGFSLHSILQDWKEVITQSMDDFVRRYPDKAFIVVIPNGANKVDGSFYLDSAVGGNWEQYIVHDLVGYIDAHYRTIAGRRSRAVAGHSMGGFGALRMLLLHADIFGVGYAISPCCLDLKADMTSSNPAWLQVLQMHRIADVQAAAARDAFWPTALAAFAIAASPDATSELGADLPYRKEGGHLAENSSVVQKWKAAMPLNLIVGHESELKRAAGIAIDYGYEDEFPHIPLTSREFGEKLLELHIPVVVEGYHGDHNNGVPARIRSRILPFIAEHLEFQK